MGKELGLRITETLQKRGMTQKELAEKVGIRQSTLCEYEKGKRRITPKMAERFAAALNTYPEKFVAE